MVKVKDLEYYTTTFNPEFCLKLDMAMDGLHNYAIELFVSKLPPEEQYKVARARMLKMKSEMDGGHD